METGARFEEKSGVCKAALWPLLSILRSEKYNSSTCYYYYFVIIGYMIAVLRLRQVYDVF